MAALVLHINREVLHHGAEIALLEAGRLRVTFGIALSLPVPSAADASRASRSGDVVDLPISMRISLDAGSPRVSWHLGVENRVRDHRLRVSFPCAARGAVNRVRAVTAFDVVDRPARRSAGAIDQGGAADDQVPWFPERPGRSRSFDPPPGRLRHRGMSRDPGGAAGDTRGHADLVSG